MIGCYDNAVLFLGHTLHEVFLLREGRFKRVPDLVMWPCELSPLVYTSIAICMTRWIAFSPQPPPCLQLIRRRLRRSWNWHHNTTLSSFHSAVSCCALRMRFYKLMRWWSMLPVVQGALRCQEQWAVPLTRGEWLCLWTRRRWWGSFSQNVYRSHWDEVRCTHMFPFVEWDPVGGWEEHDMQSAVWHCGTGAGETGTKWWCTPYMFMIPWSSLSTVCI